jgi:hypothetical protein
VTPARRAATSIILIVAALGLAAVGICMNGWNAKALGASAVAGVLFTAVGVAADVVALVIPSVAARAWQARQRTIALVGWLVWLATFVFAIVGSIGFASVNIADVTMVRASRTTPGVSEAKDALADAMRSRDAECKGGIGRYCREREQTVVDRRQALDTAMLTVAQAADPQAVAAVKLVSWVTAGAVRPTENDIGMLRLALLCLLPQLAGVLIMVTRGASGISDTTSWHGAFRFRQYPADGEQPENDLRKLEFKKNQYGPLGENIVLQEQGLFLPEGGISNLDKPASAAKADELFLDLLRRFAGQGRNVSEKPTAPNYAPTAFADEADAKKLNLRKTDFKAAMVRLFNADKVYIETYGRPSRPSSRLAARSGQ